MINNYTSTSRVLNSLNPSVYSRFLAAEKGQVLSVGTCDGAGPYDFLVDRGFCIKNLRSGNARVIYGFVSYCGFPKVKAALFMRRRDKVWFVAIDQDHLYELEEEERRQVREEQLEKEVGKHDTSPPEPRPGWLRSALQTLGLAKFADRRGQANSRH